VAGPIVPEIWQNVFLIQYISVGSWLVLGPAACWRAGWQANRHAALDRSASPPEFSNWSCTNRLSTESLSNTSENDTSRGGWVYCRRSPGSSPFSLLHSVAIQGKPARRYPL